jgi:hypothetical protein
VNSLFLPPDDLRIACCLDERRARGGWGCDNAASHQLINQALSPTPRNSEHPANHSEALSNGKRKGGVGGGKEGLRGTWRCLADSCAKRLSLNTEYSRIYSRIYSTYLPTARPYMFFCCKGFSCAAIWPCKKQRLASKKQASCVSWPFSLASRGSDAVKSKQS